MHINKTYRIKDYIGSLKLDDNVDPIIYGAYVYFLSDLLWQQDIIKIQKFISEKSYEA